MLPELRGSPAEVEQASALRTETLLARLAADLAAAVERLRGTQAADEAGRLAARLPDLVGLLREQRDASWWLRHRHKLPPHASERAYEDYPWPLVRLLEEELRQADEQRLRTSATGEVQVQEARKAEHDALAPALPAPAAALKKGGHRAFLVAGDRVVAWHNGGVRFFSEDGKATAVGAPKGTGQVDHAVIADDGSYVLMRNAGGLHRVALPGKARTSWSMPNGLSYQGLCVLRDGQVAMMGPEPRLAACSLAEAGPVVGAVIEHPHLDSHASLDRVRGPSLDLLLVTTGASSGQRETLLSTWDGRVLRWAGRHPLVLWAPRLAADGSVVARAGRDGWVRLTLPGPQNGGV